MADPGLLSLNDPDVAAQLQKLMGQFQPTEADRKAARQQALMAAGLGMLGTRRGQELNAISQAGLLGLGNYYKQLEEAPKLRMQQMQAAGGALTLQDMLQKLADQQRARQIDLQYMQQRASPTAGMPSLAPTTQNAALLSQRLTAGSNPDLYQQLMDRADYYEKNGLPQEAMKLRVLAQEKFAPQYSGTKAVRQNGQPVLLQEYKNRPASTLEGYQPLPETQLADVGGALLPWDKLRPPTAPIQKTLAPSEILANEMAQRNIGLRGAEFGLQRQRFEWEKQQQGQPEYSQPFDVSDPNGKPISVQQEKRSGLLVEANTHKPIGGPIGVGQKPLGVPEQKQSASVNTLIDASNKLTQLEAKGVTGSAWLEPAVDSGKAWAGSRWFAEKINPDIASYVDAKNAFINIVGPALLPARGAMTPQMRQEFDKMFFHQPGESKKQDEEKAQLRRDTVSNLSGPLATDPQVKLKPQAVMREGWSIQRKN